MGWPYDALLADCELAAEAALLVRLIRCAKGSRRCGSREKNRVCLGHVLPKSFLEQQLITHGFAQPGDGFYVSGELGATKATGNLFKQLLAQEKVSSAEVCHVGDHPHSDYEMPRQLGLEAELFSRPA